MCILCVIQKCSRKIATMLPWLVIPLIGLWAMSQLLPPAFRFEITSPRLACVMVLLVTLFWYEILMPQLSAWRARRNAMLRERMRFEAMEMQKLRKTATRRCRNCLTAYRDQNPGGGKFMCSYCGHISKRPVLDIPVMAEAGNSGILKDLMGKGGKMLNGKAWSENGWMCGQDWLDNGASATFSGKSGNWRKNCGDLFGYDEDDCLTEKSYSRIFVFACKLLTAITSCLTWLCRKICGASSSRDDVLTDTDHRGLLDSRGANGGNLQESRGDKARRKAEEKRLARLEREQLEEEERKQREDVARLVEERRRLRDEKLEAEKECGKGPSNKEIDGRKESERRRQERKKEKDRGSSKSNSDVEELEKRAGKESDRTKKTENDKRDQKRFILESAKAYNIETGHGVKGAAASNQTRGNAGTRYLDRMRGTFLSSSRAFTGGGFFGKSTTSIVSREHKLNSTVENSQTSMYRKDILQIDRTAVRSTHNEDNKGSSGPQPFTASNQSWIRLFPQSSASSPPLSSDSNSKSSEKFDAEAHCPASGGHDTSTQSLNNSNFPLALPFSSPSVPLGSSSFSSTVSLSAEPLFPKLGDPRTQFLPEDSEIFEDPCYVPDPKSLLGPVSESLDNFQLDMGFVSEKPCFVKTKSIPGEYIKPSPIESPLSRSRVSVERHCNHFLFPTTPKSQDNLIDANDMGIWQMWNNTSPITQNGTGPGLIGRPVSWVFHPEMKLPRNEGLIHPSPIKTTASLFKNDDEHLVSGVRPPENVMFGSFPNGAVDVPWLPQIDQVVMKPKNEGVEQRLRYGDGGGSVTNHQFEASAATSWAKQEWGGKDPRDGVVSPISRPHIGGGLYSTPDVQSMWST